MASEGISGFYVETHNWGKSVAFWQALGHEVEFETDHHSGMLRHPKGGAYIFLAERPASHTLLTYPIVAASDVASFEAPKAGRVQREFVAQHWDVMEAMLEDPDGRSVSVQVPVEP